MTVKKLVRLAADGDEGAEEELFNRGGDAKRELLELAANPKVKSNRETIAFLLLTLFPSRESYAAVASMAERESDSERKNALLIMLHAMKSK